MASEGILGAEAVLAHGATPTVLTQLKDISLSGIEWDIVEITNRQSPSKAREKIAGFSDGGELEAEAVYSPAIFADLKALGGVKTDYTITMPDGSTLEFSGILSTVGLELPFEDAATIPITITVSGVVTFTEDTP